MTRQTTLPVCQAGLRSDVEEQEVVTGFPAGRQTLAKVVYKPWIRPNTELLDRVKTA